jgi:hypothetical protein
MRWKSFAASAVAQGTDTAPVVREIVRQVEPDPDRRPTIHLGG